MLNKSKIIKSISLEIVVKAPRSQINTYELRSKIFTKCIILF